MPRAPSTPPLASAQPRGKLRQTAEGRHRVGSCVVNIIACGVAGFSPFNFATFQLQSTNANNSVSPCASSPNRPFCSGIHSDQCATFGFQQSPQSALAGLQPAACSRGSASPSQLPKHRQLTTLPALLFADPCRVLLYLGGQILRTKLGIFVSKTFEPLPFPTLTVGTHTVDAVVPWTWHRWATATTASRRTLVSIRCPLHVPQCNIRPTCAINPSRSQKFPVRSAYEASIRKRLVQLRTCQRRGASHEPHCMYFL